MNMKPIEECKHETDSSIMNEKELNEAKSTKKCADDFLSSNIQLIENELDLNFSKSDRSRYSYETNKLNSQVNNFKINWFHFLTCMQHCLLMLLGLWNFKSFKRID